MQLSHCMENRCRASPPVLPLILAWSWHWSLSESSVCRCEEYKSERIKWTSYYTSLKKFPMQAQGFQCVQTIAGWLSSWSAVLNCTGVTTGCNSLVKFVSLHVAWNDSYQFQWVLFQILHIHADVQMIFWSDPILIYKIVGLGCEAKSCYEKLLGFWFVERCRICSGNLRTGTRGDWTRITCNKFLLSWLTILTMISM